jgi:hypothetical protein
MKECGVGGQYTLFSRSLKIINEKKQNICFEYLGRSTSVAKDSFFMKYKTKLWKTISVDQTLKTDIIIVLNSLTSILVDASLLRILIILSQLGPRNLYDPSPGGTEKVMDSIPRQGPTCSRYHLQVGFKKFCLRPPGRTNKCLVVIRG